MSSAGKRTKDKKQLANKKYIVSDFIVYLQHRYGQVRELIQNKNKIILVRQEKLEKL